MLCNVFILALAANLVTASDFKRSLRHKASSLLARRDLTVEAAQPLAPGSATIRCVSEATFELCDKTGSQCLFLGQVAPGTQCINNTISWNAGPVFVAGSLAEGRADTIAEAEIRVDALADAIIAAAGAIQKTVITDATVPVVEVPAVTTPAPQAPVVVHQEQKMEVVQPKGEEPVWTAPVVNTPTPEAPKHNSNGNGNGNNNGDVQKGGKGTFFYQDGVAGACGIVHKDTDLIVALAMERLGWNYPGPDCGRYLQVTNTANGKSVTAMVSDACPGCHNYNSLDLSTAAFDAIAEQSTGLIDIEWHYV